MDLKELQKKYKISDKDIETYRYQPEILSMLEMPGFYARYCKMISRHETNEEAYEATERQFKSYFGKPKFKNYESFASRLSQWLKNR
jgi:hypothetical protein